MGREPEKRTFRFADENVSFYFFGTFRFADYTNISLGLDELKGKINDFFGEQQSKGVEEKDEADCRKYVYNWIKYHHNNKKNYGQNSRNENKVGRADISANRPEDYQGSC